MTDCSKINTVKFGTSAFPYPYTGDRGLTLGVVANDTRPATLTSMLHPSQVLGILHTDGMPIPSLLPHFYKGIELRASADPRRRTSGISLVHIYRGKPARGKSFTAMQFGRMRHTKGAIKFDASGVDARQAIWKTQLESEATRPLHQKIDERLALGRTDPLLLDQLEKIMDVKSDGDKTPVMRRYGDRATIDWAAVNDLLDHRRFTRFMQLAPALLGLKSETAVGFRMVDRPGALTRAWFGSPETEGVPTEIVFDEIDKAKEGTFSLLNPLLDMLTFAPHAESYTAVSNDGQSVTFRLADRHPLFFMNGTMNDKSDGAASSGLNASTSSRLIYSDIGPLNDRDYIHFADAAFMGLPINTYFAATDPFCRWKKREAEFAARLQTFCEWAGKDMDFEQARLLESWPRLMRAGQIFGAYSHKKTELMDPASKLRRDLPDKERSKWTPATQAIAEELALSPRQPQQMARSSKYPVRIAEADIAKANLSPLAGDPIAPEFQNGFYERSYLDGWGDRIAADEEAWIEAVVGTICPDLVGPLTDLAEREGMLRPEKLPEPPRDYICDILDIHGANDETRDPNRILARQFRDALAILSPRCDGASLPSLSVAKAIEIKQQYAAGASETTHRFVTVTGDEHEFQHDPLVSAVISEEVADEAAPLDLVDLISLEELVIGLTLPMAAANLHNLWQTDLKDHIGPEINGPEIKCLLNDPTAPCGVNVVAVAHAGQAMPVIIVRSTNNENILLIGPEAETTQKLINMSRNVAFAARGNADAQTIINRWFSTHCPDSDQIVAAYAAGVRINQIELLIDDPKSALEKIDRPSGILCTIRRERFNVV